MKKLSDDDMDIMITSKLGIIEVKLSGSYSNIITAIYTAMETEENVKKIILASAEFYSLQNNNLSISKN